MVGLTRKRFWILATLGMLTICAADAAAQDDTTTGEPPIPERLRVVTNIAPPFNYQTDDGAWDGLTIALLERIAERVGFEYDIERRTIPEMVDLLESGEADIAVAALTVTPERERRVDFCHPYLVSGLGIGVPADSARGGMVLGVVRALFSTQFLGVLIALSLLLFVVGGIVWFFERKKNEAMFGGPTVDGLAKGFWFSAVSMTTVGYGDKAPTTVPGRLVALVWMFASVIIISSFTAAIASSLTVDQLGTSIRGPEDLAGKRVAVVEGSTSERFVAMRGVRPVPFPDAVVAAHAVADGQADAIVLDRPILGYLATTVLNDSLLVIPGTFERQDYAFAVAPGSGIRQAINQAVLDEIATEDWPQLRLRYLGE